MMLSKVSFKHAIRHIISYVFSHFVRSQQPLCLKLDVEAEHLQDKKVVSRDFMSISKWAEIRATLY